MPKPVLSTAQRHMLEELNKRGPVFHGEKDPVLFALRKIGYAYFSKVNQYWEATVTGAKEWKRLDRASRT